MANSDVQISDVELIPQFSEKFGSFGEAMDRRIHNLRAALERKRNELKAIHKDIKDQQEVVEQNIKEARENEDYAYNYGKLNWGTDSEGRRYSYYSPDYEAVRRYRKEREHLEGYVRHEVQKCAELAWSDYKRAETMINLLAQMAEKLKKKLNPLVERGRMYLGKSEEHIREYMATHLTVE